jgi:hypothetical protein
MEKLSDEFNMVQMGVASGGGQEKGEAGGSDCQFSWVQAK